MDQRKELWLDEEAGLLMEVTLTRSRLVRVIGKKVEFEGCEFDTVSVDGVYYGIVNVVNGLVQLELTDHPVKEELDWAGIGIEWDEIHKRIWDEWWLDVSKELINEMADMVTAGQFGIIVEELNRGLK